MEHERSIMLFCFVNSARPDFMPIHTAHQHMADDVLMRDEYIVRQSKPCERYRVPV